jgi:hypothetical protein
VTEKGILDTVIVFDGFHEADQFARGFAFGVKVERADWARLP